MKREPRKGPDLGEYRDLSVQELREVEVELHARLFSKEIKQDKQAITRSIPAYTADFVSAWQNILPAMQNRGFYIMLCNMPTQPRDGVYWSCKFKLRSGSGDPVHPGYHSFGQAAAEAFCIAALMALRDNPEA